MELAVVIPTRNRPDALAALLDSLHPQRSEWSELLVVDQSDADIAVLNSRIVAGSHHRMSPDGLAAARNVGVRLTTAPIILFLDDDTWALPGCLRAHRAAFADPTVGAVAGRIIERRIPPNTRGPRNELGAGGRVLSDLAPWTPDSCEVATVKGANASWRREALRAVGPCDGGYGGTAFLEDADWSTRVRAAGWRVIWTPGAAVVHHSAPHGGCRVPPRSAEQWRFHNTGRFVRLHRPWSAPLSLATFAAISLRRAAQWRDAAAPANLLRAWLDGWRNGERR